MRFKANLTPIGFGSKISLCDRDLDRVKSVNIATAADDMTTVTIAAIGIDALVEGDAAAVFIIDAISGKRYRLVEVRSPVGEEGTN
jgi:hypothetical protein